MVSELVKNKLKQMGVALEYAESGAFPQFAAAHANERILLLADRNTRRYAEGLAIAGAKLCFIDEDEPVPDERVCGKAVREADGCDYVLAAGSGTLGLPGDVTPPSRFIRAAFYQASAPQRESARETVVQCFHIMNNFDIPVGIEFAEGQVPVDFPSATQWTTATDVTNRAIYYRTMYNSAIRCIDLKTIDFSKVKYQTAPLDKTREEPIIKLKI